MTSVAVALAGLLALAVQDPDGLFRVTEQAGVVVVSGNRAAVPCDVGLEELGAAVGWRVRFSANALRERAAGQVVDVAIEGRSPRVVARLLAVAGGADAVLLEPAGKPAELVIVEVPDARTAAGRERLREWALQWYRTCLEDRTRPVDDAGEEALRVRMHMAEVLRQSGRLRDAAVLLEEVFALAPHHEFVPQALLRMAECWFELGPDGWIDAERRARDLTRLHPGRPEAAAGTILLARILLAQGRAAECAAMLERSFLRLAGQPEIVDVYLLLAAARHRLADPAGVAKALATLAGGHDLALLDVEQQRERWYLAAYVDLESGRPRAAVRRLEQWFASASAADDPRHGEALVLIGEAYHADARFLQARAAAVAARECRDRLDRRHARLAAELYAKTAMALGQEDRALAELESEVRGAAERDGDLVMIVARLFFERERYARCDMLLERVVDDPEVGDAARLLRLEARFEQAAAVAGFADFVTAAPALAAELRAEAHQRRAAELIGRAYEALGDFERAADAFRGVLR